MISAPPDLGSIVEGGASVLEYQNLKEYGCLRSWEISARDTIVGSEGKAHFSSTHKVEIMQVSIDNGVDDLNNINSLFSHITSVHSRHSDDGSMDANLVTDLGELIALSGAKYCVIHPGQPKTKEEFVSRLIGLAEVAKTLGIKMLLENMPYTDYESEESMRGVTTIPYLLAKFLDSNLGEEYLKHLGICYDLGHGVSNVEITDGRSLELDHKLLKKWFFATHLHDSEPGKDYHNPITRRTMPLLEDLQKFLSEAYHLQEEQGINLDHYGRPSKFKMVVENYTFKDTIRTIDYLRSNEVFGEDQFVANQETYETLRTRLI